jgi:hypothetical protein
LLHFEQGRARLFDREKGADAAVQAGVLRAHPAIGQSHGPPENRPETGALAANRLGW